MDKGKCLITTPHRTCSSKFSRMHRPPRRKASSSSSYAHKQCAEHIACVHLPSCHHHQVSKGQEGSPHILRLTSHSPKTLPSLSGPPSPPLTAGEGRGHPERVGRPSRQTGRLSRQAAPSSPDLVSPGVDQVPDCLARAAGGPDVGRSKCSSPPRICTEVYARNTA